VNRGETRRFQIACGRGVSVMWVGDCGQPARHQRRVHSGVGGGTATAVGAAGAGEAAEEESVRFCWCEAMASGGPSALLPVSRHEFDHLTAQFRELVATVERLQLDCQIQVRRSGELQASVHRFVEHVQAITEEVSGITRRLRRWSDSLNLRIALSSLRKRRRRGLRSSWPPATTTSATRRIQRMIWGAK
jgi:hypothetical protein